MKLKFLVTIVLVTFSVLYVPAMHAIEFNLGKTISKSEMNIAIANKEVVIMTANDAMVQNKLMKGQIIAVEGPFDNYYCLEIVSTESGILKTKNSSNQETSCYSSFSPFFKQAFDATPFTRSGLFRQLTPVKDEEPILSKQKTKFRALIQTKGRDKRAPNCTTINIATTPAQIKQAEAAAATKPQPTTTWVPTWLKYIVGTGLTAWIARWIYSYYVKK